MRAARHLSSEFIRAHPGDAAPILERLAVEEITEVLAGLTPTTAAACLNSLVSMTAARCLATMPESRAGLVLAELSPDVAAVLLLRLEGDLRERLLGQTPPEAAERLRRRLRHRQGTAGALVDTRVMSFPLEITADDALARMRRSPQGVHYYLYVVDRDERLAGVLNLRQLMLASPKETLASVMRPAVARLAAKDDRSVILAHSGWLQFHALPVVDETGRFLGVVGHETMRRLELDLTRAHYDSPSTSVGLAFADLCWVGLTKTLEGVASAVLRPPAAGGTTSGE